MRCKQLAPEPRPRGNPRSGVFGLLRNALLRRRLIRTATNSLDCLAFRTTDVDLAGLHCLRHLPRQLDRQQPVLQSRAGYLDVVSQSETTLERSCRDTAIDVGNDLIISLLAADHQQVLLGRYV